MKRISAVYCVCNQRNISDGGHVVHAHSFRATCYACRDCGRGCPVTLGGFFAWGPDMLCVSHFGQLHEFAQDAPVMRPKKPFRLGPSSKGARRNAPGVSSARRTSGK